MKAPVSRRAASPMFWQVHNDRYDCGSATTMEQCLIEAAYCLGEADRSDSPEARALCLGVAGLWFELAGFKARLGAAGTA